VPLDQLRILLQPPASGALECSAIQDRLATQARARPFDRLVIFSVACPSKASVRLACWYRLATRILVEADYRCIFRSPPGARRARKVAAILDLLATSLLIGTFDTFAQRLQPPAFPAREITTIFNLVAAPLCVRAFNRAEICFPGPRFRACVVEAVLDRRAACFARACFDNSGLGVLSPAVGTHERRTRIDLVAARARIEATGVATLLLVPFAAGKFLTVRHLLAAAVLVVAHGALVHCLSVPSKRALKIDTELLLLTTSILA
jgi:hypothetical protein